MNDNAVTMKNRVDPIASKPAPAKNHQTSQNCALSEHIIPNAPRFGASLTDKPLAGDPGSNLAITACHLCLR
jgi:hypothetical protein